MSIFRKVRNFITFRKLRKKNLKSEGYLKEIRNLILEKQNFKLRNLSKNPLNKHGKKCFSQSDEDGITIEILKRLNHLKKGNFIEFGVGDGTENNTLILKSLGWKGAWVGNQDLIINYKNSDEFVFINEFVNINNIINLTNNALKKINVKDFDVISFDLDGNDYYFVEELLKNRFKPKLFIVEYNGKFLPPIKWKIDYNQSHKWDGSDYVGASISTFNELFEDYDYKLICCNAHTGANAFFIKNEFANLFDDVPKNIEDIYSEPRYILQDSFSHFKSIKTINQFFK